MNIPIENLYYLLSYSWNTLQEKSRVHVSTDDITAQIDLFAKVLINSTRLLLKRGMEQYYLESEAEVVGIKGKLAVSETLKSNVRQRQRTICLFDEFSQNVLMNQILFTTLHQLMFVKNLNKDLRYEIRYLLCMFPTIDQIEITNALFNRLRFNRNNRFYSFVLKVCQLIHNHLLPSEKAGTWYFSDFTRDEAKMHKLFESFVFNFYKVEYKNRYTVRREGISWQFSYELAEQLSYIPWMITDITLENENRKIIIDTKYYQDTLIERFEQKKIKSTNLYQLFSYLLNQQNESLKNLSATGILLYPTTSDDYDLNYTYEKHNIYIRTVNLNMSWNKIDERLREIVA